MYEVEKKYKGKKIGGWKILSYSHNKLYRYPGGSSTRNHYFNCKCKCGAIKVIPLCNLLSGKSKSCILCGNRTHGLSTHPLYATWAGMKNRCLNPKDPGYKNYGGRNIKICKRWENSFENFLADMGDKPNSSLSIDRINNDGNYEPGNCRWATGEQQASNKRKPNHNKNGDLTISEVAKLTGYSKGRIHQMSRPCNHHKSQLADFKQALIIAGKKRKIIFKPEVIDYLINKRKQYLQAV